MITASPRHKEEYNWVKGEGQTVGCCDKPIRSHSSAISAVRSYNLHPQFFPYSSFEAGTPYALSKLPMGSFLLLYPHVTQCLVGRDFYPHFQMWKPRLRQGKLICQDHWQIDNRVQVVE